LARQLTAVIMAQGFATIAQAQATNNPPTTASTPSTKLPDVVVKGTQEPALSYKPEAVSSPKHVSPLRDTPQTLNVVPRAVFEDQGATTLRDVIRNVPGISFQAGEGGVPAGDQMTIRGFSARTDMFIDGVRDLAGYTRDSFNIEAVEISKGPNSAYSGRGSTGGAINMVSKSPKLDPLYSGTAGLGTD
jgi:catecholate siderophore receptor